MRTLSYGLQAAPQCDDFRTLPPDADRCAFARAHCEGEGEGAVAWLPLYYCRVAPHGRLAAALMLVSGRALPPANLSPAPRPQGPRPET